MRLYFTALKIALWHSGRRLLCLILILVMLGSVGAGAMMAPAQDRQPTRIAVEFDERSPMLEAMLTSLVEERFEGQLEIQLVDSGADPQDYTALVRIPEGFYDGLLTGENVPPTIILNSGSPLEAMLVRQLALAATRALTAAQQMIGALNLEMQGTGISSADQNAILLASNMSLIDTYFERETLLQKQLLQATGSLGIVPYYIVAISCMLLFAYAFLLMPSILTLRRFAVQSKRTAPCFFASLTLCALSAVLVCAPVVAVIGIKAAAAMALFAVLYTALLFAIGSVFRSIASGAAICIGLALAQGLFCGAFLPVPLLPSSVAGIGIYLPLSQAIGLVTSAVTKTAPANILLTFLTAAALLAIAVLGWKFGAKEGR